MTSTAATIEAPAPAGRARLRRAPLHRLLAGQSVLVLLLSINRLSPLTQGYALPFEALR